MKRRAIGALSAAIFACASVEALAEPVVEISGMSGKVLVNIGNGYIPVPDRTSLDIGTKVMVGQNSRAYVTYLGTGCRVELPPGSVATITLPDPCEASALAPQESSVSYSSSLPWIAVGGLAAAAIVTVVVVSSSSGGGGDGDGNGGPVSTR
jgi:hypothetical protein